MYKHTKIATCDFNASIKQLLSLWGTCLRELKFQLKPFVKTSKNKINSVSEKLRIKENQEIFFFFVF